MGSNKTPELASLALVIPVITAAMQRHARLERLICFISLRQEIRELVAEEASYIFDFDGSSIEPPNQAV